MITLAAIYLEKKMNTIFHGRFVLALVIDCAILSTLIEWLK